MTIWKLLLIFSLISCFSSCGGHKTNIASQSNLATGVSQSVETEKPWEAAVFKLIADRLKSTSIRNLRDEPVVRGSREIRIWSASGAYPIRGFVFTQINNEWFVTYLPSEPYSPSTINMPPKLPYSLPPPKSDWDQFWKKLEALGIYTLPDQTAIGDVHPFPDASFMVVEIKISENYRTYAYGAFETAEKEESKKAFAILNTLSSEFGIELH